MKKHIVVRSINNFDKTRCVDIFKRENNTFGYQEYRRDLETNEGWYRVGFMEDKIFTHQEDAYKHAYESVGWLNAEKL